MADLSWAEDDYYDGGTDPTKIEPSVEAKAKGAIPGEANVDPQELNWILHEIAISRPASIDVQTFTTDGTWTKPDNAAWCEIFLVGGGGGGGESSNAASGGGGGGSGAITIRRCRAEELPATLTIDVGAGGTGNVSQTNGGHGVYTSVTGTGVDLRAEGGGGGQGGAVPNYGGIAETPDPKGGWAGSPGGDGSTAPPTAGGAGWFGTPGGAAGASGGAGPGGGGVGGTGYGAGGGGSGGTANGADGGGGGASGVGTSVTASNGDNTRGGSGRAGIVVITTWAAAPP